MDESKISVRYAKALLSLAKEKQVEEAVKADMEMIHQLFETNPMFNHVLLSPIIGLKEKRQLFENVFEKEINALTYSFLKLLVTNNRISNLKEITRNFHETYRKEAGYKAAELISAFEIDPATLEQFRALIRKLYNTEVDLTCKVDNKLIGGFILQVEDQQIDASVAAKLRKLKKELLANRN